MIELEDLKSILDQTMKQVGLADAKANILVPANGIMFLLLAYTMNLLVSTVQKSGVNLVIFGNWNPAWNIIVALLFIAACCFGSSSLSAVGTIWPRFRRGPDRNDPIYFGDICNMSLDDYRNLCNGYEESNLIQSYQKNIHVISGIAKKKFQFLDLSLKLTVAGLSLLLVTIAIIVSIIL